jgi:hypothetical protein
VRWARSIAVVSWLAGCGEEASYEPLPFDPYACTVRHDEDGDQIDDFCDNCPTVANPDQRDTTEANLRAFPDGVGDACDLWSSLAGDQIAHLHRFDDPDAEPALWTGTGWTVSGDEAHAAGDAHWTIKKLAIGSGVGELAHVRSLVMQPGGELALAIDGDGLGLGYRCAVVQDRDGDGFDELELREVGTVGVPLRKSLGVAVLPDEPFTLTAVRFLDAADHGTIVCRIKRGTHTTELDVVAADDMIGIYAMAASAATADVSSLIVYTQPASQCPRAARCNSGSAAGQDPALLVAPSP